MESEKNQLNKKRIQTLKNLSLFLSGTGGGMLIKDITDLTDELTLTESFVDIFLIFGGLAMEEYYRQKLERISKEETSKKILKRKIK